MIQTTNECCNCATTMYPCRGTSCQKLHTRHLFCDRCQEEVDRLFLVDDSQVCLECLPEMFEEVNLDSYES